MSRDAAGHANQDECAVVSCDSSKSHIDPDEATADIVLAASD